MPTHPRRLLSQQHPQRQGKLDLIKSIVPAATSLATQPSAITTNSKYIKHPSNAEQGSNSCVGNYASPGKQLFGNFQARATNVVIAGLEPKTSFAARSDKDHKAKSNGELMKDLPTGLHDR